MAKLSVGPIPLYHQLENLIAARISAGEFSAATPMPTEEQLGQSYGVSRITVRKALDSLLQQGLIIRRRGVGSFVADRPRGVHSVQLSGSLDEFLTVARRLAPRVLNMANVKSSDEVAGIFGIVPGAKVTRLELVSSGEEGPLAHCEFFFPPHIGEQLSIDDVNSAAPIVRLVERKVGVKVARARQVIEPDLAGAATARFLGIAADAPILRTQRIYYTAEGDAIEIAQLRYHPSRYRYEVDLRGRPYPV